MAVSRSWYQDVDGRPTPQRSDRKAQPREPLTDDSMVMFEGKLCRWGDMMRQDRKAYFQGGYGF